MFRISICRIHPSLLRVMSLLGGGMFVPEEGQNCFRHTLGVCAGWKFKPALAGCSVALCSVMLISTPLHRSENPESILCHDEKICDDIELRMDVVFIMQGSIACEIWRCILEGARVIAVIVY